MSDIIAPLVLALLTLFMSVGIKYLQGIIDNAEEMINDNTATATTTTSMSNTKQSPTNYRRNSLATTIYNDFLDEEDSLLQKLQDVTAWKACDAMDPRWWDGHSQPQNMWEELSKRIWISRPEYEVSDGFEYWCNILNDNKMLPWHIDKDEDASDLITPLMGAVYYGYNHDGKFVGGKLWTVDSQWNDDPRKADIVPIDPNYNRLVIFNASLWHRVSDVESGERYTFAVNALKQRPLRLTKK